MGGEVGVLVTNGGQGWTEELMMVMSAEVNEAFGLPNVIGTGSWCKCMEGQNTGGPF